MTPQPFWVIVGDVYDGSSRTVYVVCVQTSEADAARVRAALCSQREEFLRRRATFDAERTAIAMAWHKRFPSYYVGPNNRGPAGSAEAQAEWKAADDDQRQRLRDLVLEIGMMDRRYQWVRRDFEAPEYVVVSTSDDPNIAPCEGEYDPW